MYKPDHFTLPLKTSQWFHISQRKKQNSPKGCMAPHHLDLSSFCLSDHLSFNSPLNPFQPHRARSHCWLWHLLFHLPGPLFPQMPAWLTPSPFKYFEYLLKHLPWLLFKLKASPSLANFFTFLYSPHPKGLSPANTWCNLLNYHVYGLPLPARL